MTGFLFILAAVSMIGAFIVLWVDYRQKEKEKEAAAKARLKTQICLPLASRKTARKLRGEWGNKPWDILTKSQTHVALAVYYKGMAVRCKLSVPKSRRFIAER